MLLFRKPINKLLKELTFSKWIKELFSIKSFPKSFLNLENQSEEISKSIQDKKESIEPLQNLETFEKIEDIFNFENQFPQNFNAVEPLMNSEENCMLMEGPRSNAYWRETKLLENYKAIKEKSEALIALNGEGKTLNQKAIRFARKQRLAEITKNIQELEKLLSEKITLCDESELNLEFDSSEYENVVNTEKNYRQRQREEQVFKKEKEAVKMESIQSKRTRITLDKMEHESAEHKKLQQKEFALKQALENTEALEMKNKKEEELKTKPLEMNKYLED
jgi:hypothetical protein